MKRSELRQIIKEELLKEGVVNQVADAMTRYLLGEKKIALKQLEKLRVEVDVATDAENYNREYTNLYNKILGAIKSVVK